MKIKSLLVVSAVMAAISIHAESHWGDRFSYQAGTDRYFANEFSLDAFGSYNKGERKFSDVFDRSWRRGDFGGGVGLNYFFSRYFGVGADTDFFDGGSFFKNVSGSGIFRFPVGNSGFAPYIFGGVGGRFVPKDEWTFHGGVGFEVRISRQFGIFSDIRYIVADKTTDGMMVRAGLRFGLGRDNK